MDTENAHEQLINSRLAYVSVSRGRNDAQIYTNDADKLADELCRDMSKHPPSGMTKVTQKSPEQRRRFLLGPS